MHVSHLIRKKCYGACLDWASSITYNSLLNSHNSNSISITHFSNYVGIVIFYQIVICMWVSGWCEWNKLFETETLDFFFYNSHVEALEFI